MKNLKLLISTLVLFVLLVFLLSFSKIRYNKTIIKDLDINIQNSPGNFFLNPVFIKESLKKNPSIRMNGERKDISISEIEEQLNKSTFIQNADVYISDDNQLTLNIKEEVPLARIIEKGEKFYLTESGRKMSLSNQHSAEVILINGDYNEKELTELYEFLLAMNEDKLFKTIVIGVSKQKDNSYNLMTSLGHCSIQIGSLEDASEKMKKFHVFYHQRMKFLPIDYYKTIDLQYKSQIVAKTNEL